MLLFSSISYCCAQTHERTGVNTHMKGIEVILFCPFYGTTPVISLRWRLSDKKETITTMMSVLKKKLFSG